MPLYPLGQPIRLSTTVRDIAGVLADAGALTLRLYGPTGVLAQTYAAPVRESVGTYHQDIPTTDLVTAGRYRYEWTATGANAGSRSDVFDTYDAASAAPIVALADVKAALNISTSSTSDDAELMDKIAAAGRIVEWKVGPVTARSYTDLITQGGWAVWLPNRPVISLTSTAATAGGTTDAVSALDVDGPSGRVWRVDGGPVQSGQRFTYVAGRQIIPRNLTEAALIIVDHLWSTQRGGGNSPARILGSSAEDVTVIPGMGFGVPNAALELLGPDTVAPFLA